MDLITSLVIIVSAAVIHASFQLSISVLTLLSGHAIGAKRSKLKLLRLTTAFVIGAGIMTTLSISFVAYIFTLFFSISTPTIMWSISAGIMSSVAIAIWIFYYRRDKGTALWIPRSVADYLVGRTKATRMTGEAFALGLTSVASEILFIIAPMFVGGLSLIHLQSSWQLLYLAIYVVISMSPLLFVWWLISNGYSLSRIQKWREANKNFLQFAAGFGLIILSFFVYVFQVINAESGLV